MTIRDIATEDVIGDLRADVSHARAVIVSLLKTQSLGHTADRALNGVPRCLCRWCKAHRIAAGRRPSDG